MISKAAFVNNYVHITNEVSLTGLQHWMAEPAHLLIPECFSMDELISNVLQFVHDGVEVEMISEARVCCFDLLQW